jgi:hypothetical protein
MTIDDKTVVGSSKEHLKALPRLLREAERRVNAHVFRRGGDDSLASIPANPERDVDLLLMQAAETLEAMATVGIRQEAEIERQRATIEFVNKQIRSVTPDWNAIVRWLDDSLALDGRKPTPSETVSTPLGQEQWRLALPVITIQMLGDYGQEGFFEKTDQPVKGVAGVSWSQATVDFACMLQTQLQERLQSKAAKLCPKCNRTVTQGCNYCACPYSQLPASTADPASVPRAGSAVVGGGAEKANPRQLTEPEREAMGRALERSQTVIEEGSEICGKPVEDGPGTGICHNEPGHAGDCDDMPY